MAEYDFKVEQSLLAGLMSDSAGFAKLLTVVLNQVLEEQMTDSLGAERHERSEERQGYRNGYRLRTLTTRVGSLTLRVPQTRDGRFSTEIFKRYQRSEQALLLAMMEMVVQGVSTRKVSAITEELCGTGFSKSWVSSLTVELDARLKAFNERPLSASYPFIIVDALYIKSRDDDRVISRAVFTISGIRSDGYREILGLKIGDTESFTTWEEAFRWLKMRGLKGVMFIVSDDHIGLKQAAHKHFQGASWQRCQVHLMRNLLAHSPVKHRAEVARCARLVLQAPDMTEARRRLADFQAAFRQTAPQAVACLTEGFDDAMSIMALPEKYRQRLRTTNMQERLNEEIRRREQVIRIFPNDESALRLIGALLAEQNETWQEQRYFNMDEFREWAALHCAPSKDNVIALSS